MLRDRARLGPDERINFRDVVNIISGLALGQRFVDLAPEYPTFSVLVTEGMGRPAAPSRPHPAEHAPQEPEIQHPGPPSRRR